jgi:hypothetical protein
MATLLRPPIIREALTGERQSCEASGWWVGCRQTGSYPSSTAREPLGDLRCFVRGEKVRRAFRHARGSRRASLPGRRILAPGFLRYRAVSRQVPEIFLRHTDLIEPFSLDEAYLDVTENKTGLPTATQVARTIREQIRTELHLTASAGVAPNKFLAKIASDRKKPDGLFVTQPGPQQRFRLVGVGLSNFFEPEGPLCPTRIV